MVYTALAMNENDDSPCKSLEYPGYKIFRVDARSMNQYSESRFKAQDKVQIILENMNPFLFEYRVIIKEELVAEPGLEAFLAWIPISLKEEEKPVKHMVEEVTKVKEKVTLPACDKAIETVWEGFKETIEEYHELLYKELTNTTNSYNSIKQKNDDMKAILNQNRSSLESEMAECQILVTTAQNLKEKLKSGISNIENEAEIFEEARNALKIYLGIQSLKFKEFLTSVNQSEDVREKCKSKGDNEIKEIAESKILTYKERVELYEKKIKTLSENYEKVNVLIDNYKNLLSSIEETLDRSGNFTKSYSIGPYGEPTNVTVKIERKKLIEEKVPFEPLMTAKLNFGGRARFALAAGVGFSTLDNITYKRVWGFELDRNEQLVEPENFTTVVGREEDSSSCSFALLILHTRVLSWEKVYPGAFYISFGLTGRTGADKVLEYICGVSLGLAEERFFLTLGLHYGRLQELERSMYIGAPVPNEVNDITVKNKWKWAGAITLTYRIK